MFCTEIYQHFRIDLWLFFNRIGNIILFACNTFAWFTSEDEVTNRLSASADYNVQIVESFTPPNNWIPGQEVRKDVYATNTGNIPAFVKESISGVLTITTEKESNNATPTSANTKLTKAERYVMEAGSYLAYKPDASTNALGNQIVAMTPSPTNLDGYTAETTDFTPTANGLYVFRRSIGVDSTTRAENFEYEGYYYNDGEFYKVKLTSVTADTDVPDLAGDGKNTDGQLSAATFKLFEEKTEVVTPALTYDAPNHRLIATYTNSGVTTVTDSDLNTKAQALDRAEHDLAAAEDRLNKAIAESASSDSEVAKQDALIAQYQKEIDDLNAEIASLNTQKTALETRKNAVDSELATLNGDGDGSITKLTTAKDAAQSEYTAAETAYNNKKNTTAWTNYQTELSAWASALTPAKTVDSLTSEDIAAFITDKAYTAGSDEHNIAVLDATMREKKKALDEATAALDAANEQKSALTNEQTSLTSQISTLETTISEKQTAKTTAESNKSAAESAKTAAATITGNNNPASTNLTNAQTAYQTAQTAYSKAKSDYDAAVNGYSNSQDLKIYINLKNDTTTGGIAKQWQLLPATIANNTAEFYYTSILDAGTTSEQLIDSLELDENTTKDMYKSFDFDLNVALNSVQVTYDDDNVTINAQGATDQFGKTATLTNTKDINTAITWSTP